MNPHEDPKDVSSKTHRVLNYIAWTGSIILTACCTVWMYNDMKPIVPMDRLLSFLIPSLILVVIIGAILKAVLHGIAKLAHRLGERDYDEFHKDK